MPKPKDRLPPDRLPPQLPPGWRFDPDDPDYADARVYVPYIQLPDAMPLIPLTNIVIAYLTAKQINAFLRAL
jgi:hypothetical protein